MVVILDLGDVPMEAAILAYVHPLDQVSGQRVFVPTLLGFSHGNGLEFHYQLSQIFSIIYLFIFLFNEFLLYIRLL